MTREYAEMVADIVVENGLAVVFSQRIDGDDPDAGKKGRANWNFADPWPKANKLGLVAQIEAYYGKRNLLVVTGSSNVVTIDCDTHAGLDKYRSLGAPRTLAVKSGRDGGGWHFIHRPPENPEKYTFFELAGDETTGPMVTGAVSNKLHVLAGLHKTGREYRIAGAEEIAPLPQEVYDRLVRGYRGRVRETNGMVAYGSLVPESGRHDYLMGWAVAYKKLGKRADLLAALLRAERDYACEPGERLIDDAEIERMADWVSSDG